MELNVLTLTHKRACDGCTVCCEVIAAPELGKPGYARCEHACSAGCGIYESRPANCRTWLCLWAGGLLGDRYKPSECGLLFTSVRDPNGYIYLEVYEAWAGALENRERLTYLLARLREKGLVWDRILETPYRSRLGVAFQPDCRKYPGSEGLYGHTASTVLVGQNHYRVISETMAHPGVARADAQE